MILQVLDQFKGFFSSHAEIEFYSQEQNKQQIMDE